MLYDNLNKDDQGLYNLIYDATLGNNNIKALIVMFNFNKNTATSVNISRIAGFIIQDYNI